MDEILTKLHGQGRSALTDEENRFLKRVAEDRNRHTAEVYDQLGLPEFYALEGFVQWHPERSVSAS